MLKKNNIVDVFLDYQTETQWIGIGTLRKRLKKGLPFILEDKQTDEQVIYTYEVWYIDFIDHEEGVITTKPYPIRYIKSIGKVSAVEDKPPIKELLPIDSFIKVNGIEIF